jgi:rhodanese-related sulfurtransferase
MKKAVYLFIILFTALGFSFCTAQSPKIDVKKSFLVDVRTPQEFSEGTVKGAVNIPLHELEQRLDEFKGKQQIVVFCRSGNRSSQAAAILKRNGFNNVINGGSWQEVNKLIQEQTK